MNHRMTLAIVTAALAGGITISGAVVAQTTPPATKSGATGTSSLHETSPMLMRYQKMAEIMRDMTQEMSRMREQMAKGNMTADTHKQMSQRMKQMSKMMRRMSGLLDRPAMKGKDDLEMNRRMEEMRKQMDAMRADAPTAPAKK